MGYISVKEAAAKWGLGERRVRGLCQEGRVPGALRSGRDWLMPTDAERPARSKVHKGCQEVERLDLYLNPTYCDNKPPTAASQEERKLCVTTDLFLKGRFEEAQQGLEHLTAQGVDDPYLLVAQMMLYLVHAANDPTGRYAEAALREVDAILARNPGFLCTKTLIGCVRGERPTPSDLASVPSRFAPAFAQSLCYLGAMDDLAGRRIADPAYLEALALMIDESEYPVHALYANIALALYYNLLHNEALYDHHVRKSLDIALPRMWYAPLANYSYALDWAEAKTIAPEAYLEIQRLSGAILSNRIKAGLFGKTISGIAAMDASEFKVAYMSVRGFGVRDIAEALGLSTYKVRKILKSAYDHTGTVNREGLRTVLNKQFREV